MPPAAAGMQTVQLVQMRALKQMIKDSTDAFMQRYTQRQQRRQQQGQQQGQQQNQQGQQQSDYESDIEQSGSRRRGRDSAFQSSASQLQSEQVCDARTVFMPRADDLEQFLDFVAQAAAQQMQQGEEEGVGEMQPGEMQQEQQQQQPQSEMDWQTERMQPQPQQGEEEWQTERMQPEGEEAVQSSRIARLRRQLSDADIAAMCAQWRRDQSSKLGKSQLASSFAMQKPKTMQLRQSMKVRAAKLKAMKLKLQQQPH